MSNIYITMKERLEESKMSHFIECKYNYPRTTTKQEYKEIHRYLRVLRNQAEKKMIPIIKKKMLDLMLYGWTINDPIHRTDQ